MSLSRVMPWWHIWLCSLLLISGRPAFAQTLLLIGDDWCPYNCAESDTRKGYLVDLLKSIFAEQNIQVEYHVVPWTRAIKMIEQRRADLLLATTPDSSPGLLFSVPVGEDRTCFFVRNDSTWQYRDLADLRQQRLGVIQDYSYDGDGPLDTYLAQPQAGDGLVMASTGGNALQNNFRKLAAGRVDVVVENCNVGRYSLKRYALSDQLKVAGNLQDYRGELSLGLSPANPQAQRWITLIEQGLAEHRGTGELQVLLDSYGLTDWQPPSAAAK